MVMAYAVGTVLSTLLGGLVAFRNRHRMHLLLGFTAGVLLGVVAFDLLPEVFALESGRSGVPHVMLTFAAGFLVLHVLERLILMHHGQESTYAEHRHPTVGLTSALALSAHSFMDGLGLGLGFQAGTQTGIAVAIAVIAHDFADGMNTVNIMLSHDQTTRRSAGLLGLDAAAPMLGAATTLFWHPADTVLALYLGFFAGFLLYLATSDILPEAHSRHPSRVTLLATLGGLAMIWGVVSAA